MDLVLRRSGGQNVVLRPQARAPWQPATEVDAHRVEIHYQPLDPVTGALVGSPILLGTFDPTADVLLPYATFAAAVTVRVYVMPLAADGTRGYPELRFAPFYDIEITGEMAGVLGADEHVPTVTLAPTVAKAEFSDVWIVLTPAPDAYGATLTDCEIKVAKVGGGAPDEIWPLPVSPMHRIEQKPYACEISYRLRNQSAEDAGGGRGWSAWSPAAAAAEVGAAVPPQPVAGALDSFTFDPADSRAAAEKNVISQ